jgi:hypothetical protein
MRKRLRPTCRASQPRFRVSVHRACAWPEVFPEESATDLEWLVARLLARALATFRESYHARPLHAAARQAVALAVDSGFPLLTFPELFAELAIAALLQAEYHRLGRL